MNTQQTAGEVWGKAAEIAEVHAHAVTRDHSESFARGWHDACLALAKIYRQNAAALASDGPYKFTSGSEYEIQEGDHITFAKEQSP